MQNILKGQYLTEYKENVEIETINKGTISIIYLVVEFIKENNTIKFLSLINNRYFMYIKLYNVLIAYKLYQEK